MLTGAFSSCALINVSALKPAAECILFKKFSGNSDILSNSKVKRFDATSDIGMIVC